MSAVATREENQLTVIEQPNLQALNPEQFVKEAELNTAAVVDTENDDKVSKELDSLPLLMVRKKYLAQTSMNCQRSRPGRTR